MKDKRNRLALHAGGYSLIITAIVIAIIVAVNVMVSILPASYTSFDISSSQLYSISSNTKVVISELNSDVTIHWIVQDGAENEVVEILLQRYEALSDHITIDKVNPDENPTFTDAYDDESLTTDISDGNLNNSLIVEGNDKYRYISFYGDIYMYESTTNYYTYETETTITGFDGEGAITSAIDYVTSDDFPKVYVLTGHGEEDLPTELSDRFEKENIDVESFSLIFDASSDTSDEDSEDDDSAVDETVTSEDTEDTASEDSTSDDTSEDAAASESTDIALGGDVTLNEIPDDADIILIYAPSSDISEDEAAALIEYAEGGGNILVSAGYVLTDSYDYTKDNFKNLYSILENYGVEMQEGFVIETDSSYYYSSIEYIIPSYGESDITTSLEDGGYHVLMPVASGMQISDSASGVTSVLSTSDTSISKAAGYNLSSVEANEDGDVQGSMSVGVEIDTSGEGKIVWFSSSYFLSDTMNSYSSDANCSIAIRAVASMVGESEALSIPVKSLNTTYLTISDAQKTLLMLFMLGIIPAAYIAVGVIIVVRRRITQK